MKRLRYIELAIAGMALAMMSCSKDHEQSGAEFPKGVPAVMYVTLPDGFGGADEPETRHNVDNNTDKWTTKSFTVGDQIGLFATSGMVDDNGNPQPIRNAYMTYDQASGSSSYRFRNDNLLINPGMMSGNTGRYVYYPYCDKMPFPDLSKVNEAKANTYFYANPTTDNPGLLLRQRGADNIDRCVDYMFISNMNMSSGSLSGGFYHGFSELIIMRGEGFDQVDEKKKDIWVVLNTPATRLTLNAYLYNVTGQLYWRPRLHNWSGDNMTDENAKRWQAWKGVDYIDSEDGEPVPREAYYVILPTAHDYSHSVVDYIEIYNNEGVLCKVSNFTLYVDPNTEIASKQLRRNQRHALEIMMVESGATARPHEIVDWDEGTEGSNDITDERTVGITNEVELRDWAGDYNIFVETGIRPATKEDVMASPLSKYGDYDLTNKVWKFYITNNITLPAGTNIGITDLQDVLEGASPVANYTINGLHSVFIDKISSGGALRNLDFENLYIKASKYDAETAGALVNRLAGGTLENCNVNNGTMIGTSGTIGMLCGTVDSSSTVKDCSVSGAIIGKTYVDTAGTYLEGLFGNVTGSFTYQNNSTEGLIIQPN